MGSVKPGYGPKEPTPMRGRGGSRAPRTKGMPVSVSQAEQMVNGALEAGRTYRSSGDARYREQYNMQMSSLQQTHPGLHQSVLAINHLEGLVAKGAQSPKIQNQLKQANANIRMRLNEANQLRNGR